MVFYHRRKRFRRKFGYRRRGYRFKSSFPRRYRLSFRGRSRTNGAPVFRGRWATAMPLSKNLRLKYIDDGFTIVNNVGEAFKERVFRGNSAYDPDETGVGVQPYGYDQWSALLGRYRVYASKICVYINDVTSGSLNAADVMFSLVPMTNNTMIVTDGSSILALPMSTHVNVTPNCLTNHKWKVKNYATTRKVLDNVSDQDMAAVTSSNPATQWYWSFNCFYHRTPTAATTFTFSVKIIYYLKFFRNNALNAS